MADPRMGTRCPGNSVINCANVSVVGGERHLGQAQHAVAVVYHAVDARDHFICFRMAGIQVPSQARILVAKLSKTGREEPLSREKMTTAAGGMRLSVLPHHLYPRVVGEAGEAFVAHPHSEKTGEAPAAST